MVNDLIERPCATCGFPRDQHHYNGACYGVCGEFVAPQEAATALTEALSRITTLEERLKKQEDMASVARVQAGPDGPTDARRQTGVCRVDIEPDGWTLDDLAITGDQIEMLRLEGMDKGSMWGAVHLLDGRGLRLSFYAEAKERLCVTAEWEGEAKSSVVQPDSPSEASASAPATDAPLIPTNSEG